MLSDTVLPHSRQFSADSWWGFLTTAILYRFVITVNIRRTLCSTCGCGWDLHRPNITIWWAHHRKFKCGDVCRIVVPTGSVSDGHCTQPISAVRGPSTVITHGKWHGRQLLQTFPTSVPRCRVRVRSGVPRCLFGDWRRQ